MPELRFYDRERVIALCAADHKNSASRVTKIENGYGRHVHNTDCGYVPGDRISCLLGCDDSDLVITLAYTCKDKACEYIPVLGSSHEHGAVYAMVDDQFLLWSD